MKLKTFLAIVALAGAGYALYKYKSKKVDKVKEVDDSDLYDDEPPVFRKVEHTMCDACENCKDCANNIKNYDKRFKKALNSFIDDTDSGLSDEDDDVFADFYGFENTADDDISSTGVSEDDTGILTDEKVKALLSSVLADFDDESDEEDLTDFFTDDDFDDFLTDDASDEEDLTDFFTDDDFDDFLTDDDAKYADEADAWESDVNHSDNSLNDDNFFKNFDDDAFAEEPPKKKKNKKKKATFDSTFEYDTKEQSNFSKCESEINVTDDLEVLEEEGFVPLLNEDDGQSLMDEDITDLEPKIEEALNAKMVNHTVPELNLNKTTKKRK